MTEQDTLDPKRSAKRDDTEDDWSLYAKFEKGDKTAFHQLFNRYKNRILNVSYRFVQNREAAEDIAQDVLIKIYEKKAAFRSNAKFSTWVYRVTANASLDYLRKNKTPLRSLDKEIENEEGRKETLYDQLADPNSSTGETLESEEMRIIVRREVDLLPEKMKLPILLYQFEEMSYQEIAKILGITAKAVERRLYHAKEIIKKKLKKIIKA